MSINPEVSASLSQYQAPTLEKSAASTTTHINGNGHHYNPHIDTASPSIEKIQTSFKETLNTEKEEQPVEDYWGSQPEAENQEEIIQHAENEQDSIDFDEDEILGDFRSVQKTVLSETEKVLVKEKEVLAEKEEILSEKSEASDQIDEGTKVKQLAETMKTDSQVLNEGQPEASLSTSSIVNEELSQAINQAVEKKQQKVETKQEGIKVEKKIMNDTEKLENLQATSKALGAKISDLSNEYKDITLANGKNLGKEIASIKQDLDNQLITEEEANKRTADLLSNLKGATHADGTPLTEQEIREISGKIDSAMSQYITVNFQIQALKNEIATKDSAQPGQSPGEHSHFARDRSNSLDQTTRSISNTMQLLEGTPASRKARLLDAILENKKTIEKWKKETTARRMAYERLNIEDKIKAREIQKKVLEESIKNLEILEKSIQSQQTEYDQKEYSEIVMVIQSTTGMLDEEVRIINQREDHVRKLAA